MNIDLPSADKQIIAVRTMAQVTDLGYPKYHVPASMVQFHEAFVVKKAKKISRHIKTLMETRGRQRTGR